MYRPTQTTLKVRKQRYLKEAEVQVAILAERLKKMDKYKVKEKAKEIKRFLDHENGVRNALKHIEAVCSKFNK